MIQSAVEFLDFLHPFFRKLLMMSLDQSTILREGHYWKSSSRSFLHRDGYNIVTIFSDHCQLYSEREHWGTLVCRLRMMAAMQHRVQMTVCARLSYEDLGIDCTLSGTVSPAALIYITIITDTLHIQYTHNTHTHTQNRIVFVTRLRN